MDFMLLNLLILKKNISFFLSLSYSYNYQLNKFFSLGTTDSGTAASAVTEGVRRSNAIGNVDAWPDSVGLRRSRETGA